MLSWSGGGVTCGAVRGRAKSIEERMRRKKDRMKGKVVGGAHFVVVATVKGGALRAGPGCQHQHVATGCA